MGSLAGREATCIGTVLTLGMLKTRPGDFDNSQHFAWIAWKTGNQAEDIYVIQYARNGELILYAICM